MKSMPPPPGAQYTSIRKFKGVVYSSTKGIKWPEYLDTAAENFLARAVADEPNRWNSPYVKLILKDRVKKVESDTRIIHLDVQILDRNGMWKDAGWLSLYGWDYV